MKTIVIIATFAACCFAASALNLQRPSPINPSVLVEVKPQEEAVLFTDPLEIAKFKREVPQPLYPTILPEDRPHHIAKRNVLNIPYYPNTKTPPIIRNRRDVETHEKPQKSSPKPLILPATLEPETHSALLQRHQTCCVWQFGTLK